MIDWLVLAGGASSRLGADKSTTMLAGRTLVDRAVSSVLSVDPTGRVRLLGPELSGGPAAAVVSVLAELDEDLTGVLAVDMPFAERALSTVVAGAERERSDASIDAWVPTDEKGRQQWLCAVYRTSALRLSASFRDDWRSSPFHALVGELTTSLVFIDAPVSLLDIDTPDDLRHAQEIAESLRGE